MVPICGYRNKQTVSWSKIQCHSKPISKRYQSLSSFSLFLKPAFTNFHEHCHTSIQNFTNFFHIIILSHFLRNDYRFFSWQCRVSTVRTHFNFKMETHTAPSQSLQNLLLLSNINFFTGYQRTHHFNLTKQIFHLCFWWRFQPLSCPSSHSTMKSFNS